MHFVSMAAMKLEDSHNNPIPISFHKGLTLFSLITVIVCVLGGLYIAKMDPMFGKSRAQVADYILRHATGENLKRKYTQFDILFCLATCELQYIIAGGVVAATGICIMHYIGMDGMVFNGKIEWNIGILVASVIIAVIAASAAFWILFRLLSVYHSKESLRMISAIIFAIAKCAVHYVGMVAASYKAADSPMELDFPSDDFSQTQALTGALLATFFSSWVIVMLIFSDLRNANNVLNHQIYKAEDVIAKVKIDKRLIGATASIVNKYNFYRPTKAALLASRKDTGQSVLTSNTSLQQNEQVVAFLNKVAPEKLKAGSSRSAEEV
jgi:NO-binding membrane sensor protein with MHYT domain